MPEMDQTDWSAVTKFFNGVIDEANVVNNPDGDITVEIYSPALDKTMSVRIPDRLVDKFMKNLPLFEAQVYPGGTTNRDDGQKID